MPSQESSNTGTKKRGFGSMDRERQREIARQGGKAAHARGSAHEFSTDEARAAGRKGGVAVSQNRQHMAEIGRRGGEARGAAHARRRAEAAQRPQGEEGTTPSGSPQPPESEAKIRVTGDVQGTPVEGEIDTRPQTTPPPRDESEVNVGQDDEAHRRAS